MNKELLQKLVEESGTIKEILEKLNLKITKDNYKKLYKELDEYNIDYSEILNNSTRGCIKKYPIEDILVENSTYTGSRLKNRLIKEGLKQNICELCGQKPFHNGKELILQLHHINGNHQDNRLENLQILCPNCHSQTDNYAKRNIKKKQYFCKKCGAEISKGAQFCKKCLGEEHRKTNRPSKEELFELIKTLPFTEIGKMYGVTDNAVRKWCKSSGLPHLKSEIKKLIKQD